MTQGTVFGKEATEQIARTVREVARRMQNEQPHRARWQQHAGGGTIRHGIVSEALGLGWYMIQLADWAGSQQDCGAASGSGSGSGSGDPCDPCHNVLGEGTGACRIELDAVQSQNSGKPQFVLAYDCQSVIIPLVGGSDCLLTNLGDTISEASGSGSGSGGTTPVWQIVRGHQKTIVEYKDKYECCPDGTQILKSRIPVILVGVECDEILCEECPASGSGSG